MISTESFLLLLTYAKKLGAASVSSRSDGHDTSRESSNYLRTCPQVTQALRHISRCTDPVPHECTSKAQQMCVIRAALGRGRTWSLWFSELGACMAAMSSCEQVENSEVCLSLNEVCCCQSLM